jgi:hypothetical protein
MTSKNFCWKKNEKISLDHSSKGLNSILSFISLTFIYELQNGRHLLVKEKELLLSKYVCEFVFSVGIQGKMFYVEIL